MYLDIYKYIKYICCMLYIMYNILDIIYNQLHVINDDLYI